MKRITLLGLLVLTLVAAGQGESAQEGTTAEGRRPMSEADTLFAIYYQDDGLAFPGGVGLIFAAWEDGSIVWSEDRLEGGAPYRSAKINPERVQELFKKLEAEGAFAIESLNHPNWGPDSDYITIEAKQGERKLEMTSWHEGAEAGGRVVATKLGLGNLEGRKKWEVLAQEPAEYLLYRLVWSELRREAEGLIPAEGEATEGKVVMRAGKMWWQDF